jgi:hypothetical protein
VTVIFLFAGLTDENAIHSHRHRRCGDMLNLSCDTISLNVGTADFAFHGLRTLLNLCITNGDNIGVNLVVDVIGKRQRWWFLSFA